MLRNTKNKIFLVILLVITLLAPCCFAENEVDESITINDGTANATSTQNETQTISTDVENSTQVTENVVSSDNTSESTENVENAENTDSSVEESEDSANSAQPTQSTQDIYEGDLYLSGTDVTMDKLVNGNVYIIGNNVKVTGQVAGNLFILANKVDFAEAYIESSTYICANEVNFQAVTSDLYIFSNTLEIPSDYGVYRDLKCFSNNIKLLGIIGRDAYCKATNLSITDGEKNATIYGKLDYASTSEIEIPEGSVQGEVNYSQILENDNSNSVLEYIFAGLSSVIFTLVIYCLASLFTKNSIEKCTKITKKKFLLALGIGILTLIIVPIISILLMITKFVAPVGFAFIVLYGLLLYISTSVFTISIANILCEKFKLTNVWLKALCVLIISILVYILGIIPYVSIIKLLFVILGLGTIIINMFFKNIKFEKEEK